MRSAASLAVPATAGAKRLAVIARGDRPCILSRVDFGVDPDIRRRETEYIRYDLRNNGTMALALRHGGDMHRDASDRIDRNRRRGLGSVLGPSFAALGRRKHRRDVAHIGHTGLDHSGIADAVETALGPRRITARFEFRESAIGGTTSDRLLKISGIEQRAARGAVWKGIGGNEIARDDVEWIESEFDRDALNKPLKRRSRLAVRRSRDSIRSASCWVTTTRLRTARWRMS